jgi:hypothetical protein
VDDEQPSTGDPIRPTVVIRDLMATRRRGFGDGADSTAAIARRLVPSLPRGPHAVVAAIAVGLVMAGGAFVYVTRSSLTVEGIEDGQSLSRRDLATLTVRVDSSGPGADEVRAEVNGVALPLRLRGDDLFVGSDALGDVIVAGTNTLVVSLPGRFGVGGSTVERTFTFDPRGPQLTVPAAILAPTPERPATIRGLVDDAVTLTANGRPIAIEPGGAFTIAVPAGSTSVAVAATDADGNPVEATVHISSDPPPADYPPTAAVHVSARGWADPAVREPILALARAGLVNAVQLDIKDESGEVGYASAVALAGAAGAASGHYDARAAIGELRRNGVRVIGRIVCFLDPLLATWAWESGRSEMIVMEGSGGPLQTEYGPAAFTNVANADVRQYQIDLAKEAVALGFDEILYDYVRRPEGDTAVMYFPGLTGTPDIAVARFVAETNRQLGVTGAALGVSVFGIAAARPETIAQDIRLLAPHVDYVAPMVYPSHWGSGEYDVGDPLRQPADIVGASVEDFGAVVAGSGAAVVPWLQDFSAGGVVYGPVEVRAQIDAALASGASGFLLWNSGSLYTAAALEPPTVSE